MFTVLSKYFNLQYPTPLVALPDQANPEDFGKGYCTSNLYQMQPPAFAPDQLSNVNTVVVMVP